MTAVTWPIVWPTMATPIWPLVDRILDGHLAEVIQAYRDEGLTFEQMSRRFKDDHGIDVVSETVRKWWLQVSES